MEKVLFEFEKFELYKKSLEFSNKMYILTKDFPIDERFGLKSQLNRAASSISLNLAEGFSNYYKKDKNKYFRIARGSVHECIPALSISKRQNFINENEHKKMYIECYNISKMISGLIKAVNKRKNGEW
jgi:four helix bundle protein